MSLATRRHRALAAGLLALTAAAPAQDLPFPVADPAEVGLDADALTALQDVVQGFFDDQRIAGAELLVIRSRRTVLHAAIGWSDAESRAAMAPDTLFNIRSMSKPITGTLAQILIDDGALALDDPVARHLPWFGADDHAAITLDHVLTHRSGLPLTAIDRPLREYEDLAAIARAAAAAELAFAPGADFQYSDAGSDTLGTLLEVVGGAPLGEQLQAHLYDPAGMTDTVSAMADGDPRLSRTASNHMGSAGQWTRYWKPGDPPFYPFAMGSQSVFTTPADYARFLCLWMDGGEANGRRILSRDAVARGLTPVSPMGYPTGYSGLEVRYGRMWMLWVDADDPTRVVAFGHGGSDGTYAIAFPEQDLLLLYFTQSRGQSTAIAFERAVDALLLHPDPKKAAALAAERDAETLRPYLGLYRADGDRMYRAVVLHAGRLAVEIPGEQVLDLAPGDGPDDWTVELVPEQRVLFERGEDGAITGIRAAGPIANAFFARMGPPRGVPTIDLLMPAILEAHGADNLHDLGVFRLDGTLEIQARRQTHPITDLYQGRHRRKMTTTIGAARTQLRIDGETVRRKDGDDDPIELTGPLAEQARLGSLGALLSDWRQDYAEVTVLDRIDLDGEDCWLVRTVPPVGPASNKYVSVDTSRVVAEDRIAVLPGVGELGAFLTYEDVHDVGGVQIPFTWTSRSLHPLIGTIVTRFERAETNLDLGPEPFAFSDSDDDGGG